MKILLLGSTGLLGQATTAEARFRGWSAVGAARRGADILIDIADEASLEQALRREDPDLIVNCAALIDMKRCEEDPGLAYRVNARPLSFLAAWCRSRDRNLVQISTDHYYPEGEDRAHSESEQITLVNEYARSKYAGEAFALTAPKALVLRTSIIGIRGWQEPSFAEWAMRVIRSGEAASLFTDAFTSSIDVRTFARSAFDLVENGAVGLMNLAAGEVYSKAALVREMASQMGCSLDNVRNASVHSLAGARAASLGLDVRRAEALLGYELPRMREVVAAVLEQDRERTSQ